MCTYRERVRQRNGKWKLQREEGRDEERTAVTFCQTLSIEQLSSCSVAGRRVHVGIDRPTYSPSRAEFWSVLGTIERFTLILKFPLLKVLSTFPGGMVGRRSKHAKRIWRFSRSLLRRKEGRDRRRKEETGNCPCQLLTTTIRVERSFFRQEGGGRQGTKRPPNERMEDSILTDHRRSKKARERRESTE